MPHLHSHVDYTRLQHPVLDLGMPLPPLIQPPPALSPSEEYSFNVSQSRMPEQQLRASYDPAPPSTNRGSIAMASTEQKAQPSAQTTAAGKGNASGGSSQSQPPLKSNSDGWFCEPSLFQNISKNIFILKSLKNILILGSF